MVKKTRAKKEVCITVFLLLLLAAISQECSTMDKVSEATSAGLVKKGKRLFIEYLCAACHSSRAKDEIFSGFVKAVSPLDEQAKLKYFRSTLRDSNHAIPNSGYHSLSKGQLIRLLQYIETPLEYETVY